MQSCGKEAGGPRAREGANAPLHVVITWQDGKRKDILLCTSRKDSYPKTGVIAYAYGVTAETSANLNEEAHHQNKANPVSLVGNEHIMQYFRCNTRTIEIQETYRQSVTLKKLIIKGQVCKIK